ncbi:uncharacterized protein BYT42DRAFT_611102 [Radiomyces spectabilis]|uniref:uncharacterized protein n=1 Tax=Radiomyces spectabilis TaxID=64574 RepID=UPI00221E3B92|nr:uncharacterized protein BYT42DRAFT_611102 [Radiomyces spectabilis]KAI8388023.1 hypothetical protein BYT42DRAFT_611102 [Radiomyces spectabilis]
MIQDQSAISTPTLPSKQLQTWRSPTFNTQFPNHSTSSVDRYSQSYSYEPNDENQQDYDRGTWFQYDSKVEVEPGQDPAPVFIARPKRGLSLKGRNSGVTSIQKQIYRMDQGGIDPTRFLCKRLEVWRLAIKDLVAFFKQIMDTELKTAQGYAMAGKTIQVPFSNSEGQFMPKGGIQDVWGSFRNYSLDSSVLHQEYANYLSREVIYALRKVKSDIKYTIGAVRNDSRLNTSKLYDNRMKIDQLVRKLDAAIRTLSQDPEAAAENTDPYLINLAIINSFHQLYQHENELHQNILNLQNELGQFEQQIIIRCRGVIQRLQGFRRRQKMEPSDMLNKVMTIFQSVAPSAEWEEFTRRNAHSMVSDKAGYKSDGAMYYPNQHHRLAQSIKMGPMERKTSITKHWIEGLYVLTTAGYLHGYRSIRQYETDGRHPDFSIFLPSCDVYNGLSSEFMHHNQILEIRRRNPHPGLSLEKSYTFRARDLHEMEEWSEILKLATQQFREPPAHGDNQQYLGYEDRALPPLPSSNSETSLSTRPGQMHNDMSNAYYEYSNWTDRNYDHGMNTTSSQPYSLMQPPHDDTRSSSFSLDQDSTRTSGVRTSLLSSSRRSSEAAKEQGASSSSAPSSPHRGHRDVPPHNEALDQPHSEPQSKSPTQESPKSPSSKPNKRDSSPSHHENSASRGPAIIYEEENTNDKNTESKDTTTARQPLDESRPTASNAEEEPTSDAQSEGSHMPGSYIE